VTLDQNFFEDVNTHDRHIYRMVLYMTEDSWGEFDRGIDGQRGKQVASVSAAICGDQDRFPNVASLIRASLLRQTPVSAPLKASF
jgi:hypothetical protein